MHVLETAKQDSKLDMFVKQMGLLQQHKSPEMHKN